MIESPFHSAAIIDDELYFVRPPPYPKYSPGTRVAVLCMHLGDWSCPVKYHEDTTLGTQKKKDECFTS